MNGRSKRNAKEVRTNGYLSGLLLEKQQISWISFFWDRWS